MVCSSAPLKHAAKLGELHRDLATLHVPMPMRRQFKMTHAFFGKSNLAEKQVKGVIPNCEQMRRKMDKKLRKTSLNSKFPSSYKKKGSGI